MLQSVAHTVQLAYARENILLFSLNARQAGHRDPKIAIFYADLQPAWNGSCAGGWVAQA